MCGCRRLPAQRAAALPLVGSGQLLHRDTGGDPLTLELLDFETAAQRGFAPPIFLRERALRMSHGQTRLTPGGSDFIVSSLIDIFAEISLDGGIDFTPGMRELIKIDLRQAGPVAA